MKQFIEKLWQSPEQRVLSITVSGMVLGLVVDVLIASRLGASQMTDGIIIALSLPLFFDMVVREGTKFSMVPFFVERLTTQERQLYNQFASGSINVFLSIGFMITVIVEIFAPEIVSVLAPGFLPDARAEAAYYLRLTAPLMVFSSGCSILSVLLTSYNRFSMVAVRNSITPIVILLLCGFQKNAYEFAFWIACSYTAGSAIFYLLLFSEAKREGYEHHWLKWPSKKDMVQIRNSISLPTLGFIVRQGSRIVEWMIASLVSVGGVAIYYFAFRLFSSIQTIICNSLAVTVMPRLSVLSLADDTVGLSRALRIKTLWVILLSAPPAIVLMLYSESIVQLIYGWGYFGKSSVQQSADILQALSVGLIFFCLIPIYHSILYALKSINAVFRNMLIMTLCNIALILILSQRWGLTGIAFSFSAASLIGWLNVSHLTKRSNVQIDFFSTVKSLIKGRW